MPAWPHSILEVLALAIAGIAASVFGGILLLHGLGRRRARQLEAAAGRVALELAGYLTGAADAPGLRRSLARFPAAVLWESLALFTDNIGGEEWAQVSSALHDLPAVLAERDRLRRGPDWRRALAARRLGMLDQPDHRVGLRAALERGPVLVRLSAALALARAHDEEAVRWMMSHPDALDPLGLHLGVAILKRFGPDLRDTLRGALTGSRVDGTLEISAMEVLGLWKDLPSRPLFETVLARGGLEARIAAARSLGRLASRESVPALVAALTDPAWQVRAQTARALGGIESAEAVAPLARGLTDLSWWVRRNSAYALSTQGEPGTEALHRMAQLGADRYGREMAIEALQAQAWEQRSPGGLDRAG